MTKVPAVLQIIPSLEIGGAERACIDVAAACKKAGIRPLVASSGGAMLRELTEVGAEHLLLPVHSKNPFTLLANVARLSALIQQENIVLLHARSRAPAWSALLAARRCGIPFITTFHAAYKFKTGLKKKYNSVMARGDRVIAISHFIYRHIKENYGVGEDRLRLIERGIDFAAFRPDRVSESAIKARRAEWLGQSMAPDQKCLLLPGRISRIKGQDLAIEALSHLNDPTLHLILMGSEQGRDAFRRELEELAESRKVQAQVHFVTPQSGDALTTAYAAADLVLSPSRVAEGFGRVPVEAQAMEKPIIAAALGATDETVIDGKTGWLLPPGEAKSLARAIHAAVSLSPEERHAMGQRGSAHVRARFDKQGMLAKTLAVYNEFLSTPS